MKDPPPYFFRKTHVRPKPRHRSANQGCHNRTRDEAECKLKHKMNQGSKDVRYQNELLNHHLLSNGRTAIIGTNASAKCEGIDCSHQRSMIGKLFNSVPVKWSALRGLPAQVKRRNKKGGRLLQQIKVENMFAPSWYADDKSV